MSLPITAVGPLKVETNPILIESAAFAGVGSARTVAPASQNAVFIFVPSSLWTKPTRWLALCANSQGGGKHDLWCPSTPSAVSQKTMHHSSQQARMARIIVLVGRRCGCCGDCGRLTHHLNASMNRVRRD